MIHGSINPAVPDVSITLNRDGQIVASFESDETGSISYGPVPKGSYEISLFKQDYTFERVEGSKFEFTAKKVAKLDVTVYDRTGKPLEDVFVSISAGKDKQRGNTDGFGAVKFSNLTPQKYYVTAILKEYSFG